MSRRHLKTSSTSPNRHLLAGRAARKVCSQSGKTSLVVNSMSTKSEASGLQSTLLELSLHFVWHIFLALYASRPSAQNLDDANTNFFCLSPRQFVIISLVIYNRVRVLPSTRFHSVASRVQIGPTTGGKDGIDVIERVMAFSLLL